MNPPLILADLEIKELLGLAFVVITFLSWLVKQLKGDGVAPPAQRPVDKPLRSEIEVFLKELTQAQAQPERPVPPPRKPPAPKARGDKGRKPKNAEAAAAGRGKPVSKLGSKQVAPSTLGQGVRSHLASYMEDRVAAETQQHIGHRVEEAVQQDLGAAAVQAQRSGAPHPLLAVLTQSAGIRQALVVNEILQKPKALRK